MFDLFDLSAKITSFSTKDIPTSSGVIFRPVRRSWVSHVSFENVDVEVDQWSRAAGTTRTVVSMSEAMKMAAALAEQGMRVEQWGWMG